MLLCRATGLVTSGQRELSQQASWCRWMLNRQQASRWCYGSVGCQAVSRQAGAG